MKESYFKEKIYYRMNEKKPDRPTLVFVHGVSGSSSAWLPYEKIFENKYNILTYDIRGHGMSKKYPNYHDYEIKHLAHDLYDLISHLQISKFVLISHSFAALIALEYIKLWRVSVLATVFLSPMVYNYENLSAKIYRPILEILTSLNILPFNPKPRGHVDYTKHINTTDWDIRRNIADMRNTTSRIHFYCLKQALTTRQEYFLEKIKVPTLIMSGVKDTMANPKNAIAMFQKIENAKFIPMENIDHIVVLNKVKEVSEAMESFIEKNRENMLY